MANTQVVHGKTLIGFSSTSWQIYLHDKCQNLFKGGESACREALTACSDLWLTHAEKSTHSQIYHSYICFKPLEEMCQCGARITLAPQSNQCVINLIKSGVDFFSESCNWLLGSKMAAINFSESCFYVPAALSAGFSPLLSFRGAEARWLNVVVHRKHLVCFNKLLIQLTSTPHAYLLINSYACLFKMKHSLALKLGSCNTWSCFVRAAHPVHVAKNFSPLLVCFHVMYTTAHMY